MEAKRPFLREEVIQHFRTWKSAGGKEGTHLRFGQWWFNSYYMLLGIDSCPDLFYCENTFKALNYIVEHFVRWDTDGNYIDYGGPSKD